MGCVALRPNNRNLIHARKSYGGGGAKEEIRGRYASYMVKGYTRLCSKTTRGCEGSVFCDSTVWHTPARGNQTRMDYSITAVASIDCGSCIFFFFFKKRKTMPASTRASWHLQKKKELFSAPTRVSDRGKRTQVSFRICRAPKNSVRNPGNNRVPAGEYHI